MTQVSEIIKSIKLVDKIKADLNDRRFCVVNGGGVGEKSILLSSLNRQVAIITSNDNIIAYKNIFEDLGLKVGVLNADITPPIFTLLKDRTTTQDLISNIYDFILGKIQILLITPEVLLYKFHKKISINDILILNKNQEYNFSEIIKKLVNLGYKKCEKIGGYGDFSVKGDIIDIFLYNQENPIRLDFFGDCLEKIYYFDFNSMEKAEELENIFIIPNKLNIFDVYNKDEIILKIKINLDNSKMQGNSLLKSTLTVNEVIEAIISNSLSGDEEFIAPFLSNDYSVVDILNDTCVVCIDEPKRLKAEITNISKSAMSDIYDFIETGDLLECHKYYIFDDNKALCFKPNITLSSFDVSESEFDKSYNIRMIGSKKYLFDFKSLENDLRIYQKSNYKVILCAGSENSKSYISEYLQAHGFSISDFKAFTNKPQVCVIPQKLSLSWSFLDSGIVCIGTDDLVKKSKQEIKNISSKNKKRKVFFLPKVGDYVVHEIHGIGKCVALQKQNFNGNEKDYFVIEYLGGDKLYLPTEQTDLISAYLAGDTNPKLNKIGGEQFARIKQKVKESVSKLAINLLEIYSKREKSKGFVYLPDDSSYLEFENAFPYEETEDQLTAIADIKKDMESQKIMDRLICGDVGYGKTEVALRAIYKAILSEKQVAFLCPTTILSEQHYKTAKERFKDFAVNIAVLNRFKNKSQQEQIIKEIKEGKIDLIIGTHRLLSKDVCFKNLGLLVLDEEQRFGVADKEKIKELKNDIDVLTLSATPIPRTLNMALTGIRDISIIETPPKQRIAVHTVVSEESDSLILNACKKELSRGGQVLFVYNRVEHIYEQAERIRALLPNARIGVAHGQMPEKQLEDTVYKLYNGEFDVLVATTIIESGIDLPMANTLIVIDSDRLGLADLYQLRGRIGRSNRLAFAYFTYNPSKLLTSDAYKRLDAIMEFTELGSGFNIAMRDLEIRGAGDVLGKEQHGHLEKVGYDMYCRLLESAVKELKGEKKSEAKPVKIDIAVSANIPSSYVPSQEERIKLYSSISEISSEEDYKNVEDIITQTYGDMPQQVNMLLKIGYIKNLAIKLGIKQVVISPSKIALYLYKTKEIMTDGLNRSMSECKNAVLKFEDVPIITFDISFKTIENKVNFVLEFLKQSL